MQADLAGLIPLHEIRSQRHARRPSLSITAVCAIGRGDRPVRLHAVPKENAIPFTVNVNGKTMSGDICRCGTYVRIREAIKRMSLNPPDKEANDELRSKCA